MQEESNEKTCGNCAHFVKHYTNVAHKFSYTLCGHCLGKKHSRRTHYYDSNPACDFWVQALSSQEESESLKKSILSTLKRLGDLIDCLDSLD